MKALIFIAAVLIAASETGLSAVSDDDPLPTPAVRGGMMLEAARSVLPLDTLDLIGDMIVRRPRGQVDYTYRFAIRMAYGDEPPVARFTVYTESGDFLYQLAVTRGAFPHAAFEGPDGAPLQDAPALTDRIGRSDLTWLDLTLDYLWWPQALVVGEERIRGRDCLIVEVTPPGDAALELSGMRLWLDRELAMLLQAEQVGPDGRMQRRMWVRSVRKQGERWMIRDLEVATAGSGYRTRLHVEDFSTEP